MKLKKILFSCLFAFLGLAFAGAGSVLLSSCDSATLQTQSPSQTPQGSFDGDSQSPDIEPSAMARKVSISLPSSGSFLGHAKNLLVGANKDFSVTSDYGESIYYLASTGRYSITSNRASDPYATPPINANLTAGHTYVMHGYISVANFEVYWALNGVFVGGQSTNKLYSGEFNYEFTPNATGEYQFRFDNPDNTNGQTFTLSDFWVYDKASVTSSDVVYYLEPGDYQQLVTPWRRYSNYPNFSFLRWDPVGVGCNVYGHVISLTSETSGLIYAVVTGPVDIDPNGGSHAKNLIEGADVNFTVDSYNETINYVASTGTYISSPKQQVIQTRYLQSVRS